MKVRVAAIILVNNKVLLLHYNYSGTVVYTLPGGNLEFGEEMKECLERELEEELGIKTEAGQKPIFSGDMHLKSVDTLHAIYEAKITNGEPKLNPKETSAKGFEWVSLEKLSNLNLYPNVASAVLKWNEGGLGDTYLGAIEQQWY